MKKVIGLTGGVGAGKSRILDILQQEYGAVVIQTDQVAKKLESPGQPGLKRLTEEFGPEILTDAGELDKVRFAQMMFRDQKTLLKVNRMIHPMVWDEVKALADRAVTDFIVVESAILPENPDDFFDEVWYVYTLKETRIERLMESRGYSREKCLQMMENQPSEDTYHSRADAVIDNSGSEDEIRRQIQSILQKDETRS